MVIPEIYPGIEQEAVRVGSDVYEMYSVVDVIAHEYEFGDGDHMASERSTLDWFLYQAGMLTFRAFAKAKPPGSSTIRGMATKVSRRARR